MIKFRNLDMFMGKTLFLSHNSNFINNFLIPQINLYKYLGFSVQLASSLDLGEPPVEVDHFHDIGIKQSPRKIVSNYRAFKKLKKLIVDENISVINCHTPMGGVLGRLLKIPYPELEVIYTAHGFHFYKGSSLLSWLLFYPVEKVLSRYTDKLILINREDYELAKKKKFKAKKIYQVNGVGVDDYEVEVSNRENSSYPLLISVGQLNKNKNHRLIIESMPTILSKYPDAKLTIYGEGPLKQELENLIKDLKLDDSVFLKGYSNHIIEHMEFSDILISASYREGLPKNVMEALNVGLPCLVSNCRGNRDLIQNDLNGYVFDSYSVESLSNGLFNILDNYSELQSNTRNSVLPYLTKNVIEEYKEIFLEDIQ